MKNIILVSTLAILMLGCASSQKEVVVKKEHYAKPVTEVKLENLHKVDEKVYRSAQPNAEEFKKLYAYGIRYDLNLRQLHDDEDELSDTPIKTYHIPVNTSEMSYEQLLRLYHIFLREMVKL